MHRRYTKPNRIIINGIGQYQKQAKIEKTEIKLEKYFPKGNKYVNLRQKSNINKCTLRKTWNNNINKTATTTK